MKIYLVDGTYELFRSHFGAPPRKAPDGREVGATLGLVRSLLKLLMTPGITHVAARSITSLNPSVITCTLATRLVWALTPT